VFVVRDRAQLKREKVEHARPVVEEYRRLDEVAAIYYGGSLFAGLGNSTSDVDVFVVRKDAGDIPEPAQSLVEGQRVDVEFKTPEWFERISHLADDLEITTMSYGQLLTPRSDVDGAIRLLQGEDPFEDKGAGEARARLRANEDTLRRILVLRPAFQCGGIIEDLAGVLDDGDSRSAAIISRDLLLEALEGFLAGCGDLYLGKKWTWPKLRRSAGPALPMDYVEELFDFDGATHDARMDRAFERLYFAQQLLVAAFTYGWDGPDAGAWPSWGAPEAEGPRRSFEWIPLRLKDAIVLRHVTERSVKVSVQGLTLWGIARGQSRRAIVDEMLSLLPEQTDALRQEVESYLDQLIAAGAVSNEPPPIAAEA
jgi:hypothetical protein